MNHPRYMLKSRSVDPDLPQWRQMNSKDQFKLLHIRTHLCSLVVAQHQNQEHEVQKILNLP